MKYLPLIWAGLWRKPVRTAFTIISLVFAFMLFGLLRSVDAGFDNLVANSQMDRIFIFPRFFPQEMPRSYVDQVARVEGVTEVGFASFINGYYRDPKTFNFTQAVDAGMFQIYSDLTLSKEARDALAAKPNGVLLSPWMVGHLGGGIKIGDHVSIHSTTVKLKDGGQDWDFEVVGFVDRPDSPGVFSYSFTNYDYVNLARAENQSNTVTQIGVRVADPDKAIQIARNIDAVFLNSGTPTRSSVERVMFESGLASFGNIKLIVNGIMTAVLFVLLLLTATTLAQSVDERLNEFAVLKTLGFSDQSVFAFIVFESVLQCAVGAALGLTASAFISPLMQGKLPGPPVFFRVPTFVFATGALTALVVALAAAAIPGWRARTLQIVDALKR